MVLLWIVRGARQRERIFVSAKIATRGRAWLESVQPLSSMSFDPAPVKWYVARQHNAAHNSVVPFLPPLPELEILASFALKL